MERIPDALEGKVLSFGTCGCTVRGAGTSKDPVRIIYCFYHSTRYERIEEAANSLLTLDGNGDCPLCHKLIAPLHPDDIRRRKAYGWAVDDVCKCPLRIALTDCKVHGQPRTPFGGGSHR
jgi:hypothetical protein